MPMLLLKGMYIVIVAGQCWVILLLLQGSVSDIVVVAVGYIVCVDSSQLTWFLHCYFLS